jgi:drug/metabolite transporter (DMT)-like permease
MAVEWVFQFLGGCAYRRGMAIRELPLFALVAVLWGIPYLLIAVALTGFDVTFVAWARVALAAVVLTLVIGPRSLVAALRGRLPAVCAFAVVQFSVPLLLIAEAERSVPSSLVGCLIASEPLWIALLAGRMDRAERTGPAGMVGLLAGMAGVGILLGAELAGGVGGALLALGAAGCYAVAALQVRHLATDVPLLHLVAAALAISALTLLPLVLAAPPSQVPDAGAIMALAGLGIVCTAVAFPLWFGLIARVGAARAALVTYASPAVAVALGIVLLDEELAPLAPVGLALILAGSWLASRTRAATHIETAPAGRSRAKAEWAVETT